MPGWRNGRRSGLKIHLLLEYGFDSRPGHQNVQQEIKMKNVKLLGMFAASAVLAACGGGNQTQADFELASAPKQWYRTNVIDRSINLREGDYIRITVSNRTNDGKVPEVFTSPYDGYGPIAEHSFVSFRDYVDIRYCVVNGLNPVVEIDCVERTYKVEK
jgi:hypothetical protein